MKFYLALSTTTFAIICLACWAWSRLMLDSFQDMATRMPMLSEVVLNHSLYFLFVPIPWIIYVFALNKRRELTSDAVFTFTGTLFLATALLVSVVALTSILLWL